MVADLLLKVGGPLAADLGQRGLWALGAGAWRRDALRVRRHTDLADLVVPLDLDAVTGQLADDDDAVVPRLGRKGDGGAGVGLGSEVDGDHIEIP